MTSTTYSIPHRPLEGLRPTALRRVVAAALIVVILMLAAIVASSVSGPGGPAPVAPGLPAGGPPTSAQVLAAQG